MTQNVRERRYIFQSIILGIYVESSWCFIFKPYLGKMNPFSQIYIFQLGWFNQVIQAVPFFWGGLIRDLFRD